MQNITSNSIPLRNEDLLEKEVDDGIILYDPKEEKIYSLNNTAAYIWTLCNGKNSISDIINSVRKDFNNIENGIDEIIKNSIKEMISNNLVAIKGK